MNLWQLRHESNIFQGFQLAVSFMRLKSQRLQRLFQYQASFAGNEAYAFTWACVLLNVWGNSFINLPHLFRVKIFPVQYNAILVMSWIS